MDTKTRKEIQEMIDTAVNKQFGQRIERLFGRSLVQLRRFFINQIK